MITIDNKEYRNIYEQVLENANDITDIGADIATIKADIVDIKEDIEGGGGGSSQPTYTQVSSVMDFDWYKAFADALQVGEYLPASDIYNGELLLNFDQYICYAPDNTGESVRKTKIYFTLKYQGQGTHAVTLSINYKGKLYIAESYSELQTDNTYKFIFARPYLNWYEPT